MRYATFAALAATTVLAQDAGMSAPASSPMSVLSSAVMPTTSTPSAPMSSPSAPVPSTGTGGNSTGSDGGLMGIVASLTPQCRQAAMGLLIGSSESAQCLHTGLLLKTFMGSNSPMSSSSTAPSNSTSSSGSPGMGSTAGASAIPDIDAYLLASCAAAPCSNTTITHIAETVMSACADDLSSAGLSNDTVELIAQLYPVAREAVCLKTTNPPTYDPSKVGPGQAVAGNGTAGTGSNVTASTSTVVASPAIASGTASSPAADQSAPAKRQADSAVASSTSTQTGDMTLPPNATIPAGGTNPGPSGTGASNGTAPASNTTTTANTTFCATALLEEVETWWGHNLTASQMLSLVISPDARSKLSRFPAANLCTDCVYAAVSLVETGAPWLTKVPLAANTTFNSWYAETCPAANASISVNGTLPMNVSATAENSTFGFPVTFYNASTGAWETSTPNATATPIGSASNSAANSTNATASAWPWPQATGNATTPLPTGPVNGTQPTPITSTVSGVEATPSPSPAAESPAAESPADPNAAPSPSPSPAADPNASPAADAGAQTTPAARRRLRFEK